MQHEENDSSANTTPSVSAQEPQSDSQHSPSVPTTDPATTPDTTSETASDTEPETDTNGEVVPDGVRVGSPFLVDPIIPVATAVHFSNDPEVLAAGVWQETVGGAYVASIMLSVFALVSAPFFPAGGVLIALLLATTQRLSVVRL
ncbi:MAG: hypothetical protein AAFP90_23730, partial [Planctomycetota bacterium]